MTAVAFVLIGATSSMGIPVVSKILGRPLSFLDHLGFRSGPRGTTAAWCLAIFVATAYVTLSIADLPEVALHWHDVTWLKALSIVAAFTAGIVEEAFFRRMIMDFLNAKRSKNWIQIASSGILFGIAHGAWGLLGGNFQVAAGAAITTTLLGFALGLVYVVGNRSLAPCIVAHFAIDAVIEPGLLIAALSGHLHR